MPSYFLNIYYYSCIQALKIVKDMQAMKKIKKRMIPLKILSSIWMRTAMMIVDTSNVDCHSLICPLALDIRDSALHQLLPKVLKDHNLQRAEQHQRQTSRQARDDGQVTQEI